MITDQDCVQAETYEYKGLSTDTKPTNCAVNSLFLELDTGDFYFFNGTEWGKINSTIQLGEDPTGTIQITNNGIFDVHNYAEADVDVPAITPTGTISITENGTVDVSNYAEASVDVDVTVNFNLPAFKKSTPTELSQARNNLAATTVGNYALFGGGDTGSHSDVVDAYDQTLTWSTPAHTLSQARNNLAATTVAPAGGSSPQSGYALFGGGDYSSSKSNVVDAYDQTLTWSTPPHPLSQARNRLTATTVGNYALFGGGWNGNSYFNVVDAYDQTLTLTTPAALSQARNNLAATTVGNYALFGGGGNGNSVFSVVDAYSPYHDIQVFPNTKYSFNGNTEQTSSTWQTLTMQGEVTGYIKVKDATVN